MGGKGIYAYNSTGIRIWRPNMVRAGMVDVRNLSEIQIPNTLTLIEPKTKDGATKTQPRPTATTSQPPQPVAHVEARDQGNVCWRYIGDDNGSLARKVASPARHNCKEQQPASTAPTSRAIHFKVELVGAHQLMLTHPPFAPELHDYHRPHTTAEPVSVKRKAHLTRNIGIYFSTIKETASKEKEKENRKNLVQR